MMIIIIIIIIIIICCTWVLKGVWGGGDYGQIIAKDRKRTNCSKSEIKCFNSNVCVFQNFPLQIKHFNLNLN